MGGGGVNMTRESVAVPGRSHCSHVLDRCIELKGGQDWEESEKGERDRDILYLKDGEEGGGRRRGKADGRIELGLKV